MRQHPRLGGSEWKSQGGHNNPSSASDQQHDLDKQLNLSPLVSLKNAVLILVYTMELLPEQNMLGESLQKQEPTLLHNN